VRYYIEAESDKGIGDGFVPKTDDWRAEVEWADVVVFDDIWVGSAVGTGALARELRDRGTAVVGGTPNTDRLEADRGYAMEVLEDHGVDTVEHHDFEDFDAGVQHVRANPAPYVIKPLGEVQNVKRLLYAGDEEDGSDVVDVLRAYEKAWGHRMKGFQLQRKVEGVEVAVCGFFDGEVFVPVSAAEPFADALLSFADGHGVEEVTVVYGVPFPHGPEEHAVYAVATEDYRERTLAGTDIAPLRGGFFDGLVGELLARGLGADAPSVGVLVTPAHPPGPDLEAALLVLDALESIYGVGIDEAELRARVEETRRQYLELADRMGSLGERDLPLSARDYPEDRMFM
jgi:phosphoribosylamine--glycine ligase